MSGAGTCYQHAPAPNHYPVIGGHAAMAVDKSTQSSAARRFWSRVDTSGGLVACWEWLGWRNRKGYGHMIGIGRSALAHRIAYEMLVGRIPDGMVMDHLCRNPSCVNPAHLEPVTPRENTARGRGKTATAARTGFCENGHDLSDPENVMRSHQGRACRTCKREYNRAWYWANKHRMTTRGRSRRVKWDS